MAKSGKKARIKQRWLLSWLQNHRIKIEMRQVEAKRSTVTTANIEAIRSVRKKRQEASCLKFAEREAHKQELGQRFLDPRRRGMLPARMLSRTVRGKLRDYHHMLYQFKRQSKSQATAKANANAGFRPTRLVAPVCTAFSTLLLFVAGILFGPIFAVCRLVSTLLFQPIRAPSSISANFQRLKKLSRQNPSVWPSATIQRSSLIKKMKRSRHYLLQTSKPFVHSRKSIDVLRSKYPPAMPGLPAIDRSSVLTTGEGSIIQLPTVYEPWADRMLVNFLAELHAISLRCSPIRVFMASTSGGGDQKPKKDTPTEAKKKKEAAAKRRKANATAKANANATAKAKTTKPTKATKATKNLLEDPGDNAMDVDEPSNVTDVTGIRRSARHVAIRKTYDFGLEDDAPDVNDDGDEDDGFLDPSGGANTTKKRPVTKKSKTMQKRDNDDDSDDSDDNEAAFEVLPGGTKGRRKRGVAAKPIAVRKRARTTPIAKKLASKDTIDPADVELNDPGMVIDDTTGILQKFKDQINQGVRAVATYKYTPDLERAMHWSDFPDSHRYELIDDNVALVPQWQPDNTSKLAWILQARDLRKPAAHPIDLFQLPLVSGRTDTRPCLQCGAANPDRQKKCDRQVPCNACKEQGKQRACAEDHRRHRAFRFNPIDETLCGATEIDKVKALGNKAVAMMNRIPFELDTDRWNVVPSTGGLVAGTNETWGIYTQNPYDKAFINATCLIEWKSQHMPHIHLGNLVYSKDVARTHPQTRDSIWNNQLLAVPTVLGNGTLLSLGRGRSATFNLAYTNADVKIRDRGDHKAAPLTLSGPWDHEKLQRLTDLDDFYAFGQYLTKDQERDQELDPNFVSLRKASQHLQLRMTGVLGTYSSLQSMAFGILSEYKTNVTKGGAFMRGPIDGSPFWGKCTRTKGTSKISLSIAVIRKLKTLPEAYTPYTLSLATVIHDRACLAYALEQSLSALARQETLLNAIWAAHVTLQKLENGLILRRQVLEEYCHCDNDTVRKNTLHHCMYCWRLQPCAYMMWTPTAQGVQLYCAGCANSTFAASLPPIPSDPAVRRLLNNVYLNFNRDSRWIPKQSYTIEEMVEFVRTKHFPDHALHAQQYLDGYSEGSKQIMDRPRVRYVPRLSTGIAAFSNTDPLTTSLEKPHRWVQVNGKTALHAIANITVIKLCINMLKKEWSPHIIPLLKRSLQLHKQVDKPQRGYRSDMRNEREKIDTAFDNLHVIQSLLPAAPARRLQYVQDNPETAKKIREMERTGIWDEMTLRTMDTLFKGKVASPKPVAQSDERRSKFPMWTKQIWNEMMALLDDIEADTGASGLNRHGLKIPRLGVDNKIPWLWREDHCPDDADREFMYEECLSRLVMMDDNCDPDHSTDETPCTLYLEECVQWLETGGKCHIFGFIKTFVVGHPQRSSWGRGVVQRLPDGKTRDILPREHMKSGWKTGQPRTLDDYDICRRTMINESWRANCIRYNYGGGRSLIPILEQAVLDLGDSSDWFAPIADRYPDISKPRSYRDRTAWEASFATGTNLDDDDAMDLDAEGHEDLEDEELEQYQNDAVEAQEARKVGEEPTSTVDETRAAAPSPSFPDRESIDQQVEDDDAFLQQLELPAGQKEELLRRFKQWQGFGVQHLESKLHLEVRGTTTGPESFTASDIAADAAFKAGDIVAGLQIKLGAIRGIMIGNGRMKVPNIASFIGELTKLAGRGDRQEFEEMYEAFLTADRKEAEEVTAIADAADRLAFPAADAATATAAGAASPEDPGDSDGEEDDDDDEEAVFELNEQHARAVKEFSKMDFMSDPTVESLLQQLKQLADRGDREGSEGVQAALGDAYERLKGAF